MDGIPQREGFHPALLPLTLYSLHCNAFTTAVQATKGNFLHFTIGGSAPPLFRWDVCNIPSLRAQCPLSPPLLITWVAGAATPCGKSSSQPTSCDNTKTKSRPRLNLQQKPTLNQNLIADQTMDVAFKENGNSNVWPLGSYSQHCEGGICEQLANTCFLNSLFSICSQMHRLLILHFSPSADGELSMLKKAAHCSATVCSQPLKQPP